MRTAEQRQYFIAGMVWNFWASFWTGKGELIPPLHYLRMGGSEDFIFVSGVSETALDGFLTAVKSAPELGFQKQGDWWLQTNHWYGHWTVFAVTIRPALNGVHHWRVAGQDNRQPLTVAAVEKQTSETETNEQPEAVRSKASTKKRGWERWSSRNEA
jgi:hypothetical protein